MCGKDFDATNSHLGQMATKWGNNVQPVWIFKTGSQQDNTMVMDYTRKIKCKKYPKAVWDLMSRKQLQQVRWVCKNQGIKPTFMQKSTEAWISILETQLIINSHSEEGNNVKQERETPKDVDWGRARSHQVLTHQSTVGKCKVTSWILRLFKWDSHSSYAGNYDMLHQCAVHMPSC